MFLESWMFLQHLKRYNIEIIKYQIKCIFEIVILFLQL